MSNHDRWLETPYDEMADAASRLERLTEYHTAEAEKDCTEAVMTASEDRVTSVLATLGNKARAIRETGDIDDKIDFINAVCLRIDLLINDYAKAQAEKDIEGWQAQIRDSHRVIGIP